MLELTLRSTAILAAAWLLTKLMPRATAATRHLVWHGALVASVLAPLFAAADFPQVPVVPEAQVGQLRSILTAIDAPLPSSVAASSRPVVGLTNAAARRELPDSLQFVGIVGTTVVGLWFLAGWMSAARLSRRAQPAPVAWQLQLNALCQRLKINRDVRLRVVPDCCSPLTTGLIRNVILVPRTAAAWSDDRRRAVLLHELAHIKRNDCRVQLGSHIACAIYWFNPLVWIAAGELRRERERACDDQVLHLGARASSYATHLLDIASELRPTVRPSAALAMARPSELEGRLLSVLAAGRARVPLRSTRWAVVTAVSLTAAAALSATSSSSSPETPAPNVFDSSAHYVVANDVVFSSDETPRPRAEAEATLQSAPDPQQRERATLALAFSSGRDVIPALLKALADTDSQVREKAAIGLALRRDPRVVEPLIAALSDEDSQVREKAAIALGTSGDPRAHDALTRALDDPDAQVREKATAGLILLSATER
jgi:beta-lactamase regulating signal transducer with metallopeptidase domain